MAEKEAKAEAIRAQRAAQRSQQKVEKQLKAKFRGANIIKITNIMSAYSTKSAFFFNCWVMSVNQEHDLTYMPSVSENEPVRTCLSVDTEADRYLIQSIQSCTS